MKQTQSKTLEQLATTYLGSPIPKYLADLMQYSKQPPYAQEFTVRMLQLMQIAKVQPKDITPVLAWSLGNIIPRILPQAWDGMVPPITTTGRHLKFDAYVRVNPWLKTTENPLFVDLGCGFPPDTTMDSASRLVEDNWRIIGVDRSFAPFMLYDPSGHYACFNANNKFLYYQNNMQISDRASFENPTTIRTNLIEKFHLLRAELPQFISEEFAHIEKDGFQLFVNKIKDYESEHVSFIESDIVDTGINNADIVRCLNVMYYFEESVQQQIVEKACNTLNEGGVLLTGGNDPAGTHACYLLRQKENSQLVTKEFAFSLENLISCSVVTFFTIHQPPDHSKLMAKTMGIIRTDESFWPDFSKRIDQLMEEKELCKRDSNGVLQFINDDITYADLAQRTRDLWLEANREGFGQGAVDSLKRAGYNAWQNCIKDIALDPNDFE